MARVLSGFQPTGPPHLGNYLGALRHWVVDQHEADSFFTVVDLHALTVEHDPALLRERTWTLALTLLAVGLDPDISTIFVQSHVPQHSELCWLMESTATFGELRRMVQFKEKSKGNESVRASLLTYPALMAADILLYDADRVPVGDDQRQHLELTRDVALRFNHHYGETFVVPEAAIPKVGARVMDLQDPTRKMSGSDPTAAGRVDLLEDPKSIERKLKRAVTDTETEVRYDPDAKPGVSNLLEILGAATGRTPDEAAKGYSQYGPLKADAAEAVVALLAPIQARYRELEADPEGVAATLAKGADKAREVAAATLERAQRAIGLLPA